MFGPNLPMLAANRQVIAADLQGHGRTADSERPLSLEALGDGVAALIKHLGLDSADLMGYSMGGGAALRAAIAHSELVGKLVLTSVPYKRDGWYPALVAAIGQMSTAASKFMKDTRIYHSYVAVAPDPDHFPALCDKMGEMLRRDYDWGAEVAALMIPTLLVYGDAEGVPPSHAAQFFELLGGGLRDGSWDGSGMSKSQLAILPGITHYTIFSSPALAAVVTPFLDAPTPQGNG
jgi:pimeloyl-ACP methyl ester carboxylesterase